MSYGLRILSILVLALSVTACFKVSNQTRNNLSSSALPDDAIYDRTPISLAPGPAVETTQVMNFRAVGNSFEALTGITKVAETSSRTYNCESSQVGEDTSSNMGTPTGERCAQQNFRSAVKNDSETYSLNGAATSVTAPMLMSQTRLAAEACKLLAIKERRLASTQRRFFKEIDFTRDSDNQITGTLTDNVNHWKNVVRSLSDRFSQNLCGHDANIVPEGESQSLREVLADLITTDVVEKNPEHTARSREGAYYKNTTEVATLVCTAFLASSCTLTNN